MPRYFALLLFAGSLTGCATQAATSGRIVIRDRNTQVAVGINEHDRALIQDYYGKRKRNLPPGLSKRQGSLPPGLAKRDTLPPGLQTESLPVDLERQLSALPSGYVRIRVGSDVALLDNRTRVVLDVVYGIAN